MASCTSHLPTERPATATELLLKTFLREQKKSPGPFMLATLSVMIGVAAIVGIDVASQSALKEFERANRMVSGLATHRVVGGVSGLDERIYARLRIEGGLRNTAPVIEAEVRIDHEPGTWRLLGIDPLSDYRVRESGLLSMEHGDQSDIPWPVHVPDTEIRPVGSTLTLSSGSRQQVFTVAGRIFEETGEPENDAHGFLVTDIMWAQEFLGQSGRLGHIDLKLGPQAESSTVEALLPSSARLIDLETRHSAQKDMTRAFRTNLAALSHLTLLVAMFLIYISTAFQVARRRNLLSRLRAVGFTNREIVRALGVELTVVALAGSAAGIALGFLLSSFMIALVTETIDILYFDLGEGSLTLSAEMLVKATALGVLGTAIAGAVPIREAGRITVQALSKRSFEESRVMTLSRRVLPAAALSFASGVALLATGSQSLGLAFAGLFLLLLGPASCTPWLVLHACNILAPAVGRAAGLVAKTAVINIRSHLSRTGVSVIALSLAVSTSLGVALMIDSFRHSVEHWLNHYMRADLYITSAVPGSPYLSDTFRSQLASLEGVRAVGFSRRLSIHSDLGLHDLLAVDTNPTGFRGFMIKSPPGADLWNRFNEPRAVLVTEALANRHRLVVGDDLVLPTLEGEVPFRIIGIYRDYSSEHGLVTLSWGNYVRYFEDPGVTSAGLYLAPGTSPPDVKEAVRNLDSAPAELFIRSNRELRDRTMDVFDRTFEITGVLRWLTVLVAVTGLVFSLIALQLERTALNARLKAIGFSRTQLAAQIIAETSLTGLLAGLIAIPIGLTLSLSLIEVVNVRSFGWTMTSRIDPVLLMAAIGMSTVSAAAGGIYPAIRMWHTPISNGLRDD
ncbi:MAG: ABC transporter permease [Gammaproteobacteria bacterium]|nr:ABC transporter permease [Gammaproteobacteria bacterium]